MTTQELKAQQYELTGTPTVVLQYSLKMDIGRYGGMDKFALKVQETIDDLLMNWVLSTRVPIAPRSFWKGPPAYFQAEAPAGSSRGLSFP